MSTKLKATVADLITQKPHQNCKISRLAVLLILPQTTKVRKAICTDNILIIIKWGKTSISRVTSKRLYRCSIEKTNPFFRKTMISPLAQKKVRWSLHCDNSKKLFCNWNNSILPWSVLSSTKIVKLIPNNLSKTKNNTMKVRSNALIIKAASIWQSPIANHWKANNVI